MKQPEASRKMPRASRIGIFALAVLFAATIVGHITLTATPAPPSPSTPDFILPEDGATDALGLVTFGGQMDRGAVLVGEDPWVRLELSLNAAELETTETANVPTDFVVVLDRSTSMSDGKLRTARAAVQELLNLVGPTDRFALVHYGSDAEVAIRLAPATPTAVRAWRREVDGIYVRGGTNMSSGIDLGRQQLRQDPRSGAARRILLLSDGHANEGDPSFEGLTGRSRNAANNDVVVTTIGIGEGFNEVLMAAIADAGLGNYYFAADPMRLASIFTDELEATRETVARALVVEIRPAPGVRVAAAAGYPLEELDDGRVIFRPGSLYAGQERRFWVTFEVTDQASRSTSLGTVRATYNHREQPLAVALNHPLQVEKVRDQQRFAAAVDREVWKRGMIEEDYNRLREEVATSVRKGRRDEAKNALENYRISNAEANERIGLMAEEAAALEAELKALEEQVEDAFTGADQASKQNKLSKVQQELSRDLRRIGAKKGKSPPPQDAPKQDGGN